MPMTPVQLAEITKAPVLGILTTVNPDGSPQATPVYYVYEDGKLHISVTKDRKKTYNVQRDPRVAVCVLAEEPPFNYVQVMGRATVTEDDLVERSRRIWSTFRSQLPDDFPQLLADQKRVVMVVTPERATSRVRAPGAPASQR